MSPAEIGVLGLMRRYGRVQRVSTSHVEATGLSVRIGEMCSIESNASGTDIEAEVIGLHGDRQVLMPLGPVEGIAIGDIVTQTGHASQVRVGNALLGRVIDPFGNPLDGGPRPQCSALLPLYSRAPDPMTRPLVARQVETGIRVIDSLLPIGRGQRIGIFSGSGVGKSTLLGMLARNAELDVNVVALIGERGREVREFVENQLGPEGLARSVVVVATADRPAIIRARAAYVATTIAEHFRGNGRHVLLTMDSVTRFAMALREGALANGEPPTARGYTPSVFNEIPKLCERCGTSESGGSITALYTVLVEGDDFNEPISDTLRATLDGHLILTRELAHDGHFPAVDPLQSNSRLMGQIVDDQRQRLATEAVQILATYRRNQSLIELGAYRAGASEEIDRAIELWPRLRSYLRQGTKERISAATSIAVLTAILGGEAP